MNSKKHNQILEWSLYYHLFNYWQTDNLTAATRIYSGLWISDSKKSKINIKEIWTVRQREIEKTLFECFDKILIRFFNEIVY